MKIIFWGTPTFAIPSLESLFHSNHQILSVITQPDKRRSRGKGTSPSPIKQKAIQLGIPIITTNSIKGDELNKIKIKDLKADIYVVVAFGQILPKEILEYPKYGCWNSHGSLLPKWRGAAPIQRSIASGDKKTGVGIMLMEEGLDTGPILIEEHINIKINDNFITISSKLSLLSGKLLIKALDIITNKIINKKKDNYRSLELKQQNISSQEPTYAKPIERKDRLINWEKSALEIHKQIMGFYPGAYSIYKSKILKIEQSEPLIEKIKKELTKETEAILNKYKGNNPTPGLVIGIEKGLGFVISCLDYPLIIKKAKLEGKKSIEKDGLIQQLSIQEGYRFI